MSILYFARAKSFGIDVIRDVEIVQGAQIYFVENFSLLRIF